MNYIDLNFKWLTDEIENKTKEELFLHIKNKYTQLPVTIKENLEKFLNDFGYWGKLSEADNIFEQIENKVNSLKDHLEDYKWLYNHLGDYRSKKLLFGILYNWYDYDFMTLKSLMDNTFCHYFDLDILDCKDEVFVDVGAYIGDTTMDFINSYQNYKKIYCYEMTDDSFDKLVINTSNLPNIEYRKKAVSNCNEKLRFDFNSIDASANNINNNGSLEIQATSLDEDIDEKITLIKMDIEGYESKAITGASRHIREDHPKLLISVYHNHDDLWKIPKMIEEIAPGYKFYLRYYSNYIFPTEIVLFGIYE